MRFASALVVLSKIMVVQSNTLAKVRAVLREYHDGIGLEGGPEEKERQQGKLRSLLTALGMQDDITPTPAAPVPAAAAPPAPPLPDGEPCIPQQGHFLLVSSRLVPLKLGRWQLAKHPLCQAPLKQAPSAPDAAAPPAPPLPGGKPCSPAPSIPSL